MDSDPNTSATTEAEANAGKGRMGDVTVGAVEPADPLAAALTREESQAAATRRWGREGIAAQVAEYRDRMRGEFIASHPGCKRRDAHEYAWSCAMSAYPPPGTEPSSRGEMSPIGDKPLEGDTVVPPAPVHEEGVAGLGDLPADWPTLPANAQLQVEIAWVSANRLRVRSGSGVDLSRALSPAPSYAALSWLETSILFPAKFADISVKATAQTDDEKEHIRRERLAIDEIRGILAEMLEG